MISEEITCRRATTSCPLLASCSFSRATSGLRQSVFRTLVCLAGMVGLRAEEPESSPQAPARLRGVTASPQVLASPQRPGLIVPPGLPRYDLDVRLDPQARTVAAREQVVFTNRSGAPTGELVFHVYPRYALPEKEREAVVLYYLEQFSAAEIGGMLGVSVNVVDVRLHRARARLKNELAGLMKD